MERALCKIESERPGGIEKALSDLVNVSRMEDGGFRLLKFWK